MITALAKIALATLRNPRHQVEGEPSFTRTTDDRPAGPEELLFGIVPALQQALQDEDPDVRLAVVEAPSRMGPSQCPP